MGYLTDGLTFNTLRGANVAELMRLGVAIGKSLGGLQRELELLLGG